MQSEDTLSKRFTELSAAKQALLEKRLRQVALTDVEMSTAVPATIARRPPEERTALSFAQKSLWFLQQLDPESVAYNEITAVYLRGPLDFTALEQAGREIMRRHAILRSTFPLLDGEATGIVDMHAHEHFTLPIIDLSHVPVEERPSEVQRIAFEKMQRPFKLTEERPWSTVLLHLDEQEHVSLTIMHHMITDGWSSHVFVDEVGALYSAFSTGQPSPLPELAVQYTDYAYWQSQRLESGALAAHLDYWKERLGGSLPRLALPTDRPRPAVQTYHGRQLPLTIPAALLRSLETINLQEGTTLFMTLLTALNVLLYCYSQQDDILVGSPIAGRVLPELENLLGCFVNTLVMRADLSGRPTFRELLAHMREITLGAYEHQELSFEKLVEELQPERSLSYSPLFQVMFTLQNMPTSEQELAGLTIGPLDVENTTAKYDLSLSLGELNDQCFGGFFEYNRDLFDHTTIERLAGHFLRVLECMVENLDQHIDDFVLLNEAEWQQQIVEWNATLEPFPLARHYVDLFADQVARTPGAPAVICEGESLSYAELDQRANRLAHYLQRQGVGPDSLVALLDDRGIPLLTAILAVFKAGGAYLPLDPAHPTVRLRQILEHSRSGLVLVGKTFTARVQAIIDEMDPASRPAWCELESITTGPETAPVNLSVTSKLAYVIYTSGSTGQPKGAMIEQRGMLNHLYAKFDILELGAQDCVAQTASQCFDISIWQFLAALPKGGCVQIVPNNLAHDPQSFLASMEQMGISILEIVPSFLRALLENYENDNVTRPALTKLRWLVLTGEALPADLCRRWFALYPLIPILNSYGPTECSDNITHQVITEYLEEHGSIAPIGRPLPNTRLYILNRLLQPAPIGVSGELYAGGVGVGRGYLGDASRTAEAFVPDPFSSAGGERLYRTGDLARFQADGTIDFLGRIDFQVKIRGYRIELGEIEKTLESHPAVQNSVVVAREDLSGNQQLIAYVVIDKQNLPKRGEILSFLSEHLPEYMVPGTFILLDALPLTPNGKIDRAALPHPQESSLTLDVLTYIAPRTPVEQILAGIWAEVLGIGRVGVDDNFFEIGGHSLLVTQVIGRVREVFDIDLPFRMIFTSPTVASLAAAVEKIKQRSNELRKPSVAPISRDAYRMKRSALGNEGAANRAEGNGNGSRLLGRVNLLGQGEDVEGAERVNRPDTPDELKG